MLSQLSHLYHVLLRRDEGATMVEYGLMVALIAVIALGAVTLLGVNVTAIFDKTAETLQQ